MRGKSDAARAPRGGALVPCCGSPPPAAAALLRLVGLPLDCGGGGGACPPPPPPSAAAAASRPLSLLLRARALAVVAALVVLLVAAALVAWRRASPPPAASLSAAAARAAAAALSSPRRPIHVVLRTSGRAQSLNGGVRPPWFSKALAFANLLATADNATSLDVLFDGDGPPPAYLTTATATAAASAAARSVSGGGGGGPPRAAVHAFRGGSGDASFRHQLAFSLSRGWDGDDIVYLLEDDYLHAPGWPRVLREGFAAAADVAYVTLYDHADRYWPPAGLGAPSFFGGGASRVMVTASAHWRAAPSTTNTFAALARTLRADAPVHDAHGNGDHDKFLALGARGRVLVSSIPGYSTHAVLELGSPVVDWEAVARAAAATTPS